MTVALLTAVLLAQPNAGLGPDRMAKLARAILPAAIEFKIDPLLLGAVALIETGGRNVMVYKRGRKGAGMEVGAFQIHCWPAGADCIKKFGTLEKGAREAARILAQGRRICQKPSPRWRSTCLRGFWSRYNPGSIRWSKRLQACYSALKSWIRKKEQQNAKST